MSFRRVCEFTVDGVPVPQGSKTGFVLPAKGDARVRAIVADQNAKTLKPWRQAVAAAARDAYAGDRVEGAVLLVVEFRFVRPRSVSVKSRPFPTVKPDIDKLERSLLDGITDSGLWRDDAQVVQVSKSKVYAERPGVHVQVGEYIGGESK